MSEVPLYTLNPGTCEHGNNPPVGPYSTTMSRTLWWSLGGVLFLMSEGPLYLTPSTQKPASTARAGCRCVTPRRTLS